MQAAPTLLTPFDFQVREQGRTEWLRSLGIGLACVCAGTFCPRRIPNAILDALAAQHRPTQAHSPEP